MKNLLAKRRKSDIWLTTMTGALLGLGAPAGYILFSFLFLNPEQFDFLSWGFFLWDEQLPLLLYLTFPTVTVFSAFGWYHGWQESRLALKSQQMEEFLAIAAHDICNPLTVMKEGLDQMAEIDPSQTDGDGARGTLVKILAQQTRVMSELVEELLDLHKIESRGYELKAEPTEILPLIEKAVEEMKLLVSQKRGQVKIVTTLPRGTEISVDPFRIRQLIRNLLGNAVRHMSERGTIFIYLWPRPEKELEIAVHNEGECIKEERLPLLFDKFGAAKDRAEKLGHGLGLTICKDIVDLHHGRIWVENVKPSGVCFHVSMPWERGG